MMEMPSLSQLELNENEEITDNCCESLEIGIDSGNILNFFLLVWDRDYKSGARCSEYTEYTLASQIPLAVNANEASFLQDLTSK